MSVTLTNVSFDKPSYTPGQLITATLNYSATDFTGSLSVLTSFTMSFTLTDSSSGATTYTSDSDQPQFQFAVTEPGNAEPEAVTGSATDSGSRAWTEVSSTVTSFAASTGASQGTIVLTATA